MPRTSSAFRRAFLAAGTQESPVGFPWDLRITKMSEASQSAMLFQLGAFSSARMRQIGFSIADQALAVGGMFLANVELARTQSKEDYGIFALTYSVFTFLAGLHNGAILETYTVYGSGRYNARFAEYARLLWRSNALLGLALTATISIVWGALYWIKPTLASAVIPGTNTVLQNGGGRDSDTVWMDLNDPDPARRFKAFALAYAPQMNIYFSPDGIHWSEPQLQTINSVSDRTTVFWNPFRNVWVNSARGSATLPATSKNPNHYSRVRYYSESRDLKNWSPVDPLEAFWTGPDEDDPPYAGAGGALPELYNLDAVPYESVLVGLFSWFNPGPAYNSSYGPGPDLVELGVGFSRDGFHWVRPTRGGGRNAFIAATNVEGTWNAYNTQSSGGGFLVVGDELWFYFSGRSLRKPAIGVGSTGLAVLRRDGPLCSFDCLTECRRQYGGNGASWCALKLQVFPF